MVTVINSIRVMGMSCNNGGCQRP